MLDSKENCYFNKKQIVWLILSLSAVILEIISLYFQHIILLKPCVLCIYQRCALFGIILSGLFLSTPYILMKTLGATIWTYSAWNGFLLAKKQGDIQIASPFITCDFFVNFPYWLPLDKWIPFIFYANGDCTEHKWYFLTLEISQWMKSIFFIYLIIPIVLIIFPIRKYLKKIHYILHKNKTKKNKL